MALLRLRCAVHDIMQAELRKPGRFVHAVGKSTSEDTSSKETGYSPNPIPSQHKRPYQLSYSYELPHSLTLGKQVFPNM